jgi:CheY-like chemotaxis protein
LAEREGSVQEAPLILVVEDDYPLQGVVEDFLRDGGFETHALSSGEEALTQLLNAVPPT